MTSIPLDDNRSRWRAASQTFHIRHRERELVSGTGGIARNARDRRAQRQHTACNTGRHAFSHRLTIRPRRDDPRGWLRGQHPQRANGRRQRIALVVSRRDGERARRQADLRSGGQAWNTRRAVGRSRPIRTERSSEWRCDHDVVGLVDCRTAPAAWRYRRRPRKKLSSRLRSISRRSTRCSAARDSFNDGHLLPRSSSSDR